MDTSEKQWYLLTSKPHKDKEAEQQLLNQDYTVYRPLAQRVRKLRGKMVPKVESLFPRYLFIQLDQIDDNWGPIRSTIGVQNFVRFGAESLPIIVPPTLIETLKANESHYGERVIDLDRFKQGEEVIVTEGAFSGIRGAFQQYEGDQRAMILIDMMGKITKLPISPAYLAKA